MKRSKGAKVRRSWGVLHPGTRVLADKTKRPFRKRKHKTRLEGQ